MKIKVEVVTINGQDKLRQWNPAVKEWQYRNLDPHEAERWRKAIANSAAAGRRALDGVRNNHEKDHSQNLPYLGSNGLR